MNTRNYSHHIFDKIRHKYTLENSIFKTRYWKNWVPTGIRMEWDSYMSSQDWGSQILCQILSEYHLVQVFLRIPIPLYTLMSWASTLRSKLSSAYSSKAFHLPRQTNSEGLRSGWSQQQPHICHQFSVNYLFCCCHKISDSTTRKKGFILDHSLRVQIIMKRLSWWMGVRGIWSDWIGCQGAETDKWRCSINFLLCSHPGMPHPQSRVDLPLVTESRSYLIGVPKGLSPMGFWRLSN